MDVTVIEFIIWIYGICVGLAIGYFLWHKSKHKKE